ncbi:LysE family translocator [Rheinheimera sp. 4Y26]|uniref:LysE family translocator n=1 Tax=Rheinheimera sp. 4Y26 TaxID=2977811 RepID=UPI0021B14C1D|nr:LysE family transporter [Rheinheimera sp. 4Y26]MCT6699390.1 LysE family transporter [Rheinheimera sp. 4Y26]
MSFWPEFLLVASVHFVAVASPGPDFAIILRYAVRYGVKVALSASIGIGLGILLHVAYSLLGIGLLLQTTPWLFQLFSLCAAAYLAYIGIQALRSGPGVASGPDQADPVAAIGLWQSFRTGLLTNGLNPKATLFFLALFAVIISPETPMSFKIIYGVYMAVATALWFSLLSFILTRQKIRSFLLNQGYWFDRLMGIVLLALAMHLLYSALKTL